MSLTMAPPASEGWEGFDVPEVVGGWAVDRGSGGLEPGVTASTPPGTNPPLYSPQNPLFWLAVLGLLGTGAIFVSTHWRIGNEKGSISI